MFCEKCGKQIPDGSTFCPHCGDGYEATVSGTKLGLGVGATAAIMFLSALMGYEILLLVAGYILIVEKNQWLRSSAVKAVVLYVTFFLGYEAIDCLNDAFGFINVMLGWLKTGTHLYYPASIDTLLLRGLDVAKTVMFVLLAVKAMKMQTIKIGFVDKFTEEN